MSRALDTPTIYLDHAAATPLDPAVWSAMEPYLRTAYGNPSSIHQLGRHAHATISAARAQIAAALQVESDEIIFTGSGTESDNLAICGLARAHRTRGRHVIVSAIEHKAVLAAAAALEAEGFSVTYLPVDDTGQVELATLKTALTEETILVSVMYANNEIGTIEPIKDIATLVHDHYGDRPRPLVHTDACQAVGILPISPRELGVDAMTINSAKIYGPKGIGLLYVRRGVALSPLIVGGGQEAGRRAGTEQVALAVGFATALTKAVATRAENFANYTKLYQHFYAALETYVSGWLLNGHQTERLPNNLHLCVPDIEGEAIVLLLDAAGICAATGSACNSADLAPSHVLQAIGRDDQIIHGSVRFSFGRDTTPEMLTHTAKTLGDIQKRLGAITASSLALAQAYVKHS